MTLRLACALMAVMGTVGVGGPVPLQRAWAETGGPGAAPSPFPPLPVVGADAAGLARPPVRSGPRVRVTPSPDPIAPGLAQAGGPGSERLTVGRDADGVRLGLRFPRPVAVDWTYEGRDLVLRFDQPTGPLTVEDLPARLPDVIAAASAGYDSLLIETVERRRVVVSTDGTMVTVRFGPPTRAVAGADDAAAASDAAGEPSQAARLRAAVLRARAQLESGDLQAARASLQALAAEAPDNAEVLSLLASVEARLNRPQEALALYDRALAVAPDDPFLLADRRRLARTVRPGVRVGFSVTQVEDAETQVAVAVNGGPFFVRGVRLTTGSETRYVDAPDARQTDGTIADFTDTLNRFDVDAEFPLVGTVLGQVGLSGTRRGTVGLELGATAETPMGRLAATLALHDPYWGFVEALVGDGWRDRVAASVSYPLTPDTTLRAGAGFNRYGLGGGSYDALTETATATAGVTQVVLRRYGVWAVEYTLDAEYALSRDEKPIRGLPGQVYEPIPIETRENHSFLASWYKDWSNAAETSAYAGYTLDRFGDDGFVFGGRFDLPVTDRLDLSGEAARSLINATQGSGGVTDRVGVSLRMSW